MDRIGHYIELLANLCGFGAPDAITRSALLLVLLAACVLIYAFCRAIYVTIWPGETNADHIKRRVLIEEDVRDGN